MDSLSEAKGGIYGERWNIEGRREKSAKMQKKEGGGGKS